MAKKITENSINKATKKAYPMRAFKLTDNNGDEWDVVADYKMNPEKTLKVVDDTIELLAMIRNEDLKFDFDEAFSMLIFLPLMLRHFTDIEIPKKDTALDTIYGFADMIEKLEDLGLLSQIVEVFDKDAFKRTSEDMSFRLMEVAKGLQADVTEKTKVKQETENEVE